jgi:predicted murein hydrolase (TIGR00659 family)
MIELFSLIITFGFYLAARKVSERWNHHPLLSPPVLAMFAIIATLMTLKIPYADYFRGARPIHFMLGPATVSFALPLYLQISRLRKVLVPLMLALVVGSFVGIVSAVAIGYFLGLPHEILLSLAPKSVTTPIAMGISEKIGGTPALATVFVMITGIIGALIATTLLKFVRVKDPLVKGFSIGIASHGLGTYRAFQIHEMAGAFAGLAMALNGLMTAILIPMMLHWIP